MNDVGLRPDQLECIRSVFRRPPKVSRVEVYGSRAKGTFRNLGYMKDRVLRDFTADDSARIAGTFHAWKTGAGYADVPGFCKAAKLDDIRKHDYVLTPGRYVGAAEREDDGEPFEEKMARLTARLSDQFNESRKLEGAIRENLARLGYGR